MENNFSKKELFKRFVNNECTPEERALVFEYLNTGEADNDLHAVINKEILETERAEENIDAGFSDKMYQNISVAIQSKKAQSTHKGSRQNILNHFLRSYWKLAAVCTGVLILAGIIYNIYTANQMILHTTAYGETATIILPDQSKATLNGNSSIQYASRWKKDSPRRVWVSGEVFFSVTHTASNQKFIVNTSDQFNVEVLGTEFNIYNRKNKTRVVLNSGKVKLNIQDEEENKQVTMTPGELVEFNGKPKSYVKKEVNVEMYSSWMNKKLILENTSFREIAILLEETYGLSVVVPDPSLYDEKFSGIVPSENATMLINALSLSFNLNIHKKGKQVKFQFK